MAEESLRSLKGRKKRLIQQRREFIERRKAFVNNTPGFDARLRVINRKIRRR